MAAVGADLKHFSFVVWKHITKCWVNLMYKLLERVGGKATADVSLSVYQLFTLQLILVCHVSAISGPRSPLGHVCPRSHCFYPRSKQGSAPGPAGSPVCMLGCGVVMMMPLPSVPSASLLLPPWRWILGYNPTHCRETKRHTASYTWLWTTSWVISVTCPAVSVGLLTWRVSCTNVSVMKAPAAARLFI